MLKYYNDTKEIRDVGPKRRGDFSYWQGLLDESNTGAEGRIRAALNGIVDTKLSEHGWTSDWWFCSSFLPGSDWRGTPYEPIYEAMCDRYGEGLAWNQSRLFFGLLVKDVMIRRREHWLCYKVLELDEIEKGTNYFPDMSTVASLST
jgi:hypothetical protein